MSDYNLLGQDCNPVHTDNSLADTGQPLCVPPKEYGQEASGKQEIQDFSTPSPQPTATTVSVTALATTATTPSNQSNLGTSTAQNTLLFQYPGKKHNTLKTVKHRRSWTSSHKTYQSAARREYELLLKNSRVANHLITVNYFREYSAQEIGMKWKVLKASLQQQGIIAFVTVEVTTKPHVLPNGELEYYPVNRIHYHCLVDSSLPERQLRTIFKQSCFDAGLSVKEFRVLYEAIPDRKSFERKCKYILKFDNF